MQQSEQRRNIPESYLCRTMLINRNKKRRDENVTAFQN